MEKSNDTPEVTHPGKILGTVLKRRGKTQEDMAWKTDTPYGSFRDLCNGKPHTKITPELAHKLEKEGILTTVFWQARQKEWDERIKPNGKRNASRAAA